MIAFIQGDVYDEPVAFEIIKQVDTESIVSHPELTAKKVTYLVGSQIEGYPAKVTLTNVANGEPISEVEGVLLEKGDGHVVVPFEYLKEVGSDVVDDFKEGVSEASDRILPEDGILGFSYKQLLFLGALTLIITKLVKN